MSFSKKSRLKNKKHSKLLPILFLFLVVALTVYLSLYGSSLFTREEFVNMRRYIQSFGIFSPLIVVFLIFLSTSIPPLPLPVPLIELAAGVAFGFVQGSLIVWLSQIGSSVFAFYIARFFRKRFFGVQIIKHSKWDFYRAYLSKKGAFAVFLIRFVMAAPFNIISYLAGATGMPFFNFLFATIVGTIPESLLYTFLGSQIRTLHIRFVYLSILIVCVGSIGFVFTLALMLLLRPSRIKLRQGKLRRKK